MKNSSVIGSLISSLLFWTGVFATLKMVGLVGYSWTGVLMAAGTVVSVLFVAFRLFALVLAGVALSAFRSMKTR